MDLEEVDIRRRHPTVQIGLLAADIGRLQKEGIFAIMDRQRVVGANAGQDLHRSPVMAGGELGHPIRRDQDHCRRAVTDWAAVHHVDGRGDHRRVEIGVQVDGPPEHGVGIVDPVAVGVDAETSKGVHG